MHKYTDSELICRALQSDQKAYTRLLMRYYDNIYFYILKMAKNKIDASDLTQETFDKAFRHLDKYSEKYAFSTWLYKIARNCTIDFIRKNKVNVLHIDYRGEDESSVSESSLYSGTPNPEENMICRQEESILLKYIQSMKPRYRRLIELRYLKQYAYEEMASELNLPLGTVKTQLFRAKNILATMIFGSAGRKELL
ncbi:MAG: sigma-70 family RNA polymerase sigma factor [Prevotellaceae bacterium]|jgi:RNA polymerase sigma-70 factor (ECF subfamily)|nr:sigma-70 family RNA polymerase sigma factor [Prevotellaceae bacterium]